MIRFENINEDSYKSPEVPNVWYLIYKSIWRTLYTRIKDVHTSSLAQWVECLPMARETWVQSQVASYQRLLKWYLIPLCLTLSNIRLVSRVKWSNPKKGVAPSPTPRCSSYWKGSLLVALNYGRKDVHWYIRIIYVVHSISFQNFLYRHLKLS